MFGATGGTSNDAAGNGGAASEDSSVTCSLAWGTPPGDPGYRGLRGMLKGQPLAIDAVDVSAWTPICGDAGPPPKPDLSAYIALPGMSLWLDGPCAARVTTPNETDWHPLRVEISGTMAKPMPANDLGYVDAVLMGGHLRLQGQAMDGPFLFEADFYLEVGVSDPCIPPQPIPG